jgi:chitodextrinase
MKKNVLLLASLMLALATNAMSATIAPDTTKAGYVVHGVGSGTAAATSPTIGKLSKGVVFSANYTTSGYAIVTFYNFNPWKVGDNKAYGTANDSTSIYSNTLLTAAPTAAPSDPSVSGISGAGWSSL